MEGLTGYVYRGAHHTCFRPVDRYSTSFISPKTQGGMKGELSSREINDMLPEHNRRLCVIPQILANRTEGFPRAALILKEYGCKKMNLNLGCPSSTVVSKNKGAGFLSMPHTLGMFLGTVTEELNKMGMGVSVKAQLGIYSSDEFYHLLETYNKCPLTQLIIHSRVHTDYYRNTPNRKMFGYSLEHGGNPVYYNGDLFTAEDFRGLTQQYPKLGYVMMGREIITNPGLMKAIETGAPLDKVRLEELRQRIYEGYRGITSEGRNVLFRIKEIWASMIRMFSDNGEYGKKVKKAQRLGEYEAAVSRVFRDLDIVEGAGFKLY